jgi:hypothetical protein
LNQDGFTFGLDDRIEFTPEDIMDQSLQWDDQLENGDAALIDNELDSESDQEIFTVGDITMLLQEEIEEVRGFDQVCEDAEEDTFIIDENQGILLLTSSANKQEILHKLRPCCIYSSLSNSINPALHCQRLRKRRRIQDKEEQVRYCSNNPYN